MTDYSGLRLGNYQLERLLGQGGFADVYLGTHVYLKTQVAIKVLQTRLTGEDVDAFLNEARTIASLVHPHIVRVLDSGIENSLPFLVMDYAPHGTLRRLFPRGVAQPPAKLVPYVKQVASALQYAHERNLVHRDIKPENMLIGREGEVLLSDFGIATAARSSRSQEVAETAGTVIYMAPEQLRGKPRAASDQYALGIVVYEWLSGNPPFQGTFSEVASQHLFADLPSLRQKVPSLSPALEAVVRHALAKDPHQRFATIAEFAHAFESACILPSPHPGFLSGYLHDRSHALTGVYSHYDKYALSAAARIVGLSRAAIFYCDAALCGFPHCYICTDAAGGFAARLAVRPGGRAGHCCCGRAGWL